MKTRMFALLFVVSAMVMSCGSSKDETEVDSGAMRSVVENEMITEEPVPASRLAVLWTSGDPQVATHVCFMYTNSAKKQGWFDEVTLIIWGPSAKLLCENEELQEYIKNMKDNGVKLEACFYCAKMYGVEDKLSELGVEVKGMGTPLTDYLKKDWKVITF